MISSHELRDVIFYYIIIFSLSLAMAFMLFNLTFMWLSHYRLFHDLSNDLILGHFWNL